MLCMIAQCNYAASQSIPRTPSAYDWLITPGTSVKQPRPPFALTLQHICNDVQNTLTHYPESDWFPVSTAILS